MPKVNAADVSAWVGAAVQLISIGATTYNQIRRSMIDAGFAADDARLVALKREYDERVARRRAEAGG